MTKGQKIAVGILVGVPLVCLLGGMAVMQGLFGSAARTRDRELALARAAGIPTTPEELSRLTAVPEKDNAAPYYRQLDKLAGRGRPLGSTLDLVTKGAMTTATAADRARAIAALPRVAPLIALAREAAARPACDFRRDWTHVAALQFPEFPDLRGVCKALCLDSSLHAQKGDWRSSLDDVRVMGRISKHVGDEPLLIGAMVSIALRAIAMAEFHRLVDRFWKDKAFVASARATLMSLGPFASVRYALMGELVAGRSALGNIARFRDIAVGPEGPGGVDGGPAPEPNAFERGFFGSPIVKEAFDARLTRFYLDLILAMPSDPEKIEEATLAAGDAERRAETDRSFSARAYQALIPTFSMSVLSVGREISQCRLAETALRLIELRNETGAFPNTLPDFGSCRLDPFTKYLYHYRRENKGFMLYGLGPDRVDHGGTTSTLGTGGFGYDEVFRVHG